MEKKNGERYRVGWLPVSRTRERESLKQGRGVRETRGKQFVHKSSSEESARKASGVTKEMKCGSKEGKKFDDTG